MEDNNSSFVVLSPNTLANKESPSSLLPPKVVVENCQIDFFYEKFKQSYSMFKNPRGQCLIMNIYQINGMPPRRWSDRDTEALKQLWEQLLFNVHIYTDTSHDLNVYNFNSIVKQFSQLAEHEEAQSCVVCLMSHGEEGFLTTKEGDKVLLDDIFSMFNNVNCPSLAGKPKLFFIQSCRDDPITGPAEDLGIRYSFNQTNSTKNTFNNKTDYNVLALPEDCDGSGSGRGCHSDNNNIINSSKFNEQTKLDEILNVESMQEAALSTKNILSNNNHTTSDAYYHIPSLCDMLIGFPTQKGFIAYRKPEIGSWYMNAIVQVFSKHSHDTDLCAMLNMVNSLISNEVTNTGKKQMSEFTSKLTKPYFYFFPGLAIDLAEVDDEDEDDEDVDEEEIVESFQQQAKKQMMNPEFVLNSSCLINGNIDDQSDSSSNTFIGCSQLQANTFINNEHIEFLADKARTYWKHMAREMNLSECQIVEIDKNGNLTSFNKLKAVLDLWMDQQRCANSQNRENLNQIKFCTIVSVLTTCRLNKIKDEFLAKFNDNYS
jgi:uncharacterized protein YejL (UPF0352 family)